MKTKICVKGERCSGTNYLYSLLNKNFKNIELCDDFGWKHDFLDTRIANIYNHDEYIIFIIFRNSYDWINSLYKNPHHIHPDLRDRSFSEFIRNEWTPIIDGFTEYTDLGFHKRNELLLERNPITLEKMKNIFELRNLKNKNFLGHKHIFSKCVYVNLEYIQSNWDNFLLEMNEKYFKESDIIPINVEKYKGDENSENYKPAKYDKISIDDFDFILNEVDWNVEREIGYSKEEMVKLYNNL